jgi:hypothetical protein
MLSARRQLRLLAGQETQAAQFVVVHKLNLPHLMW